LDVIAL